MPFFLKEKDIVSEVARFRSVLIVPCRFCPAVSLSVRSNRPFIKLLRGNLKTQCYEDLIKSTKSSLEKKGVRTDVFKSSVLNYAHCMWPTKKRRKLLECASEYEAVVVIGCEAAYEGVRDIVKSNDCQVFNMMESEGLLTVTPKIGWPCNISLELIGVTKIHSLQV